MHIISALQTGNTYVSPMIEYSQGPMAAFKQGLPALYGRQNRRKEKVCPTF